MPSIELPRPGRPHVILEAEEERSILDVDAAMVVALYKAHGALLFRGFEAGLPSFRDFARQFCSTAVVNESRGRSPLDPSSHIHTVDAGTAAFALHPELSREPWKPDAAFFACLTAPASGGATTICDGVELVAAMPGAVRRGLEGRRLLYINPTWPELLEYWLGTSDPDDELLANPPSSCPYQFRRFESEIMRFFSRPALHRPMFHDGPAFGNFLLFARFSKNIIGFPVLDDGQTVPDAWLHAIRAAGDGLSAEISWKPGDVLMLDNSRFMHGRTAIPNPDERLIATFFGYLSFAIPDGEEPADAPWRRMDFSPPLPPREKFAPAARPIR